MDAATRARIDAVWRIESPMLIGGLTRIMRDVTLAEDLAQNALLAALESWPRSGVPDNPGAWLMATAKHRAIDQFSRQQTLEYRHEQIARQMQAELAEQPTDPTVQAAAAQQAGDDLLGLIFMCCHPVLAVEAQTALTLRLLGGLTTEEIANAFLISRMTVQQRIVSAKRTLSAARVPFGVPHSDQLDERLPAVLDVIYLIFNEGYSASGPTWTRPELCEEALRLGRMLAELMPTEAEAHGLVALMELQASRLGARKDQDGAPLLLSDHSRAHGDQLLIGRQARALERAVELSAGVLGPYTLQAEIAACHARARSAQYTDWKQIVALYDGLLALTGSPVVELSRAVAVAMADGPQAGLEIVEELFERGELDEDHLMAVVHADLLVRVGRNEDAYVELTRAAELTRNELERRMLLNRARSLFSPDDV